MAEADTYFELFLAHRAELVRYASGIMKDDALAEDVVQDAFLRLTAAPAIQGRILTAPLSYIYRIVRNLAVDRYRRREHETRLFDQDMDSAADSVGANAPSPEDEAAGNAQMRAMRAAMTELPERTCIALEMHLFDGRKLREIAAHLGISIALAHTLVATGMEHCRKRLTLPKA